MNENTILNLQEALAHQDQEITDLNDVIINQGKEIDLLKAALKKLNHKIEALENNNGSDQTPLSTSEQAAQNKPPHY